MFEKKLFQKKIDPRCAYCARGVRLEEERILCAKKGIVTPAGSCRGFQYDPLKRTPPKPISLDTSGLEEKDFRLE